MNGIYDLREEVSKRRSLLRPLGQQEFDSLRYRRKLFPDTGHANHRQKPAEP